MRLGLNAGYSGATIHDPLPLAILADDLGFDSIWTAEAYGSDAVTPLTWMGAHTKRIKLGTAIMQMSGRTPTMTAMTAATLDALSGGRFLCGVGASGPQVVEGWLGQPYGKPLAKTREFIDILRACWKREGPVEHHGAHYDIPLTGGTGLGKPLKMILHPRADIPIYLAAIGPKNVALAAEMADGFIPAFFSPYRQDVFTESLENGFAKRSADLRPKSEFDVVATCKVVVTDDIQAGLDECKPALALYIGGMGAKGRNFYYDLAVRYGFEAEADQIQEAFLSGQKLEAIGLVPNELADETALVGPPDRIRERFGAWQDSAATTMLLSTREPDTLKLMADVASR